MRVVYSVLILPEFVMFIRFVYKVYIYKHEQGDRIMNWQFYTRMVKICLFIKHIKRIGIYPKATTG